MKNRLYPTVLIFLLAITSATAQENPLRKSKGKLIHSGIRLGVNLSNLNVKDAEFSVRNPAGSLAVDQLKKNGSSLTGLVGGVWLRVGRGFFIQPEVLISAKGGTFDLLKNSATTGAIPETVKVDFKTTNIDLPFLVGVKLKVLRLYAGPIASFAISENGKLGEVFQTYSKQPIDQTLQNAVFGYQIGAGLDLKKFKLDVRYEGALTDVSAIKLDKVGSDTRFTSKTNLWQITLGYEIF